MKENNLKMLLVILLVCLAIALVGFMILLLTNHKMNFIFFRTKGESKIILEETYPINDIQKIIVNASISDIKILASETDNARVVIYGEEKDNASSILENHTLTISNSKKNKICFGFCFWGKEEVLVYLPKNEIDAIELKSVSGDIEVSNTPNASLEVKTTSGEIKLSNVQDVTINTTSGDILVDSCKNASMHTVSGDVIIGSVGDSVDIVTTSGEVKITDFICKNNSNIKTVSGDVSISQLQDAYVEAKTISGDIKTDGSNRYANNTLTIKTTSGDINVK